MAVVWQGNWRGAGVEAKKPTGSGKDRFVSMKVEKYLGGKTNRTWRVNIFDSM